MRKSKGCGSSGGTSECPDLLVIQQCRAAYAPGFPSVWRSWRVWRGNSVLSDAQNCANVTGPSERGGMETDPNLRQTYHRLRFQRPQVPPEEPHPNTAAHNRRRRSSHSRPNSSHRSATFPSATRSSTADNLSASGTERHSPGHPQPLHITPGNPTVDTQRALTSGSTAVRGELTLATRRGSNQQSAGTGVRLLHRRSTSRPVLLPRSADQSSHHERATRAAANGRVLAGGCWLRFRCSSAAPRGTSALPSHRTRCSNPNAFRSARLVRTK
jgi:hypothetical protein